ncbi:MAG TPA: dethiobiotin synthase [Candidatus Blautia faecavium]|uniref:ATP-dependent dethiobiotin synthetase BioD n=1 Tax=Candidatus Blautia faecavium TaxID=2838487 RepID=A0A9D2LQ89_9FIRM|nr:dethiobiotin synthase [Candidatus Blautia faecavium]
MSKNIFITGTGTDVGKTYVTGLILKTLKEGGMNPAYFKAAMSGNQRAADHTLIPGDALHVKEISGISQPLGEMCPYVYEHAVSPHLASRLEGNPVKMDRVLEAFHTLCRKYDTVTVEGSGGILCPICYDEEDIRLPHLISALDLSCLLVADAGLGTINDVGLTAFYMKAHGIPLKGIIFNRFQPGNLMHEDNLKMCQELTGVKVIACVKEGGSSLSITSDQLEAFYE